MIIVNYSLFFSILYRIYSIIEFDDGVSVVLTKWLNTKENKCFYPSHINVKKDYEFALKTMTDANTS